ncbi:MAG: alpha/beta hydrolase [Bacteroidota bacterium]
MKYNRYYWEAFDGKELFAQSWETENKPRGVILLVHGIGDHGGRYAEWAKLFTEKDFSVLAMDYRGHGLSGGKKGHAKSLEAIFKDIDVMIQNSNHLFPGVKRVLYGHSMGGNIVINYFLSRYFRIDALIITSPWLRLVKEPSPLTLMAAKLVKKIAPSLTFNTGIHANQLSTDIEKADEARKDELLHHKISAKLYFEATLGAERALANVFKINVPILCMHGTGDKITSPKACEDFVMNTSNKTHYKNWDVNSHELHHDPKRHEIFNFVVEWLKKYNI